MKGLLTVVAIKNKFALGKAQRKVNKPQGNDANEPTHSEL